MRAIRWDPATHPGIDQGVWARWEARAGEATKAMRAWFDACAAAPSGGKAPGAQPEFKDAVWCDLKSTVVEPVFRGQCAFCQAPETVNGFGDAEHYRPKGAVQTAGRQAVTVGSQPHPGYGWLAYDWRNLVVACSKCNTAKACQFPVAKAHCTSPVAGCETTEELNVHEEPLLLHPYFDHPQEHLRFGIAGVIAPRGGSARGAATIAACDLDREPLTKERGKQQLNAWRKVMERKEQLTHALGKAAALPAAIRELEEQCVSGEESFGLAILDYLYLRLDEEIAALEAARAAATQQRATRP